MKNDLRTLTRCEIYFIAKEYAESKIEQAGEHFAEKYQISESTFYAVLHKAVLESIVSCDVARKIQKKAAENSRLHGGKYAQIRTFNTYEELINRRAKYRLKREEAKKIVRKYIASDLFLEPFSKNYYVDAVLLKRALSDVIVYSWVSDDEVELIKEKTRKQKGDSIEEGFTKLMQKRLYNKINKK